MRRLARRQGTGIQEAARVTEKSLIVTFRSNCDQLHLGSFGKAGGDGYHTLKDRMGYASLQLVAEMTWGEFPTRHSFRGCSALSNIEK
jgi:hypothetical protein